MLTDAEHALRRALDYLAGYGLRPEPEVILDVIHLIGDGLRQRPDDLLGWVMEQLPGRFGLQPPAPPPAGPPLHRDSMGYGRGR